MTDDLVAFLRARLDEDERMAREAYDLKHRGEWVWRNDSRTTVLDSDGIPIEPAPPRVERGPHIARWHPARVLHEVEAKRRIVEHSEHAAELAKIGPSARDGAWFLVLRFLALPYAGHPDYRDEWRP